MTVEPLYLIGAVAGRRVAIELDPGTRPQDSALPTIVIEIDGYFYGLVLDRIDDVVAADRPMVSARAPLGGPWSAVSAGIIEIGGSALPVLEPAAILAAMPARAA